MKKPFNLEPMTIKRPRTSDDRERINGVPVTNYEYSRIKWHMHHDVSYMFTKKEDEKCQENK